MQRNGAYGAVQGRSRVDDEEGEARLGHHRGRIHQQLHLVVGVVRAAIRDVVHHVVRVKAKALRYGYQSLRSEGAFGIDDESPEKDLSRTDRMQGTRERRKRTCPRLRPDQVAADR